MDWLQRVDFEGPRGLNRHRYSPEEAAAQLEVPVVKALHQMCRFRNVHPAFNGQVTNAYVIKNPCLTCTLCYLTCGLCTRPSPDMPSLMYI